MRAPSKSDQDDARFILEAIFVVSLVVAVAVFFPMAITVALFLFLAGCLLCLLYLAFWPIKGVRK